MSYTPPPGWREVPLPEALFFQEGPGLRKRQFRESGIPFLNIRTFKEGRVDRSLCQFLDSNEVNKQYQHFLLQADDIICSSSGTIGRIATITEHDLPLMLNTSIIRFRPLDESVVERGWIRIFLQSQYFLNQIRSAATGSTQLNFGPTHLKQMSFLIPPLQQQKRIVAKIEELFSHIDAGIDALKKAKQLLKQYRQSVLKAAVTGELTREWREANKDKLEPASKLLERILKERRQKWEEQQLVQFKVKGKLPGDDKWMEKYKEPELSEERFFDDIPSEWAVASIDQLAWDVSYGSSSKTNEDERGVPILRMGNIVDGKLDYSDLKYLQADHNEFPDLLLEDGDLLFNRTNSAELVGKTAVYRNKGKSTSFASYLIRLRMLSNVESDFVAYFINSSSGKKWIKSCVSQNVGQANVNGTKLKGLVVPVPSYDEQKVIVRYVEEKLLSIDRMFGELDFQLLNAEKNKQSVLTHAFSGEINNGG